MYQQRRKKFQASKDAASTKGTPDNLQRIQTILTKNQGVVVSGGTGHQPLPRRVTSSTKNTFTTRFAMYKSHYFSLDREELVGF